MLDDVVPEGPVVLIGHSMGGMTIIALAEQHPELFGDRVVGVGADLDHRRQGRPAPDPAAGPALGAAADGSRRGSSPRWPAGTAPSTGRRRIGRSVATVATDALAFGDDVPASYVEFVDEMLSSTPFEVVAEFFPNFGALDKYETLNALSEVPTSIICGTDDKLTSIGHSRKLHSRIDGSTLLECEGAGHMVIMERHDQVERGPRPADRRGGGASRHPVSVDVRPVGPEDAADGAVGGPARLRGPPDARPAGGGALGDRGVDGGLARQARRAAGLPRRASRSGALVLDPVGSTMYLRRFGVVPEARGTASPGC